jgi:hypothetical protein
LSQLLEQALAGTYTYQAKVDQDSPLQLLFKGEADRLSVVTVSPPIPFSAPIAFTAVTLSVDASLAPGLAIREKALPNFDPFDQVTPILVDPTIIAVRFRYLRRGDSEASWEQVWDAAVEQPQALPQAIEVTLTAMINGQVLEQSAITLPIKVTAL